MSDEPAKIILGDTAIAATEQRPQRFFGRGRQARAPLTYCENCGAELNGRYCSQCGQPAIDYRRSFRHVIVDVLDSFLNWDSKVFATIALLIIGPWQLTNEFVAGKRARYLHPLRLYLLASILFFFAVNYWAKSLHIDSKPLTPEARAELEAELKNSDLPPVARAALEKKLQQGRPTPEPTASAVESIASQPELVAAPPAPSAPPSESTASPSDAAKTSPQPQESPSKKKHQRHKNKAESGENEVFQFGREKPSNRFEKWLEHQAKEKIGENGINAKLFLASMISNLPYMMLCAIPVFALVLKILYIRRHVLYIDHLIYALHIHTFAYIATISIILITIGLNRTHAGALGGWIIALLWCAFAVQIFLSIRRVYRQGWFKSFVKFWLGGVVYLIVLLAGFFATFLITLAIS
jgi:Protein of unknown function (DUF3667)